MFLRNLWYFALSGAALKAGAMTRKIMLDEPLLIARGADGAPFALRDICPHRGIPLSDGVFDGHEVECCYHGWKFDRRGCCTEIPSLTEDQHLNLDRIQTRSYPCREVQGNIWVFFGDGDENENPPPELPGIDGRAPGLFESMIFPSPIDHAVVGLMDPAHGPYVHRSWWWRSRRSMHEKSKKFVPAPLGFAMLRHPPSSNSAAYKLLGGAMTTEISFRLPGVRIEHIEAGKHVVCGLTAVTPLSATETEVNHAIYWTQPWLTPLKPVLRAFVRAFLGQDRDVVVKQQQGLRYDPKLMLINDADLQAKWYYQLKRNWEKAQTTGDAFENPVTLREMRWRS
ncbi:MAG: phenylpropionate dioxygenase-like ring-hydroxylating dioxygenase large terminal subunit [Alphaproteobacteria bacterium]|jgi:phenylpropionate dioxygenase-like ring-hydroxylating dioxygenase large terminal subunit